MSFGVLQKGINSIYFRNYLDLFFEFIPQIIFMVLTFGYMDFLIFYKWSTNYWPDRTAEAPSIITVMINMPLAIGNPGEL